MKYLVIIFLFFVGSGTEIKLYNAESNRIINDKVLADFFDKLEKLSVQREGTLRITHIGDSHIQADFLTGQLRHNFQNNFGNAGRGFIFPYKLAKTRGALDVQFSSSGAWQYCDILHNYTDCDIGAAGFSVSTFDSCTLKIKVKRSNTISASFNKVKVLANGNFLRPKETEDYTPVTDTNNPVLQFETLRDSLILVTNNPNSKLTLEGFVLENNESGIVYNSLGINGSSVVQYLRSKQFEVGVKQLETDLLIVSFGTNDCYVSKSKFCKFCTKESFKTLVKRIRNVNPSMPIILTTPPDHYFKGKYPNSNMEDLQELISELCVEEGCALWDLYGIMGGKNSVMKWRESKLVARDLIHFTKTGYGKQADMFFEAFMESFHNY